MKILSSLFLLTALVNIKPSYSMGSWVIPQQVSDGVKDVGIAAKVTSDGIKNLTDTIANKIQNDVPIAVRIETPSGIAMAQAFGNKVQDSVKILDGTLQSVTKTVAQVPGEVIDQINTNVIAKHVMPAFQTTNDTVNNAIKVVDKAVHIAGTVPDTVCNAAKDIIRKDLTPPINNLNNTVDNGIKAFTKATTDVTALLEKIDGNVHNTLNNGLEKFDKTVDKTIGGLDNALDKLNRFSIRLDTNSIKLIAINSIGGALAVAGILLIYKAATESHDTLKGDNDTLITDNQATNKPTFLASLVQPQQWQSFFTKLIKNKYTQGTALLLAGLGIILKSDAIVAAI